MKTFNSNDIKNLNIEQIYKYFYSLSTELYFLSKNIDNKIDEKFDKNSKDKQILFIISRILFNTSTALDSVLLLHK